MDAARQLAQLLERARQLLLRAGEQLLGRRPGPSRSLPWASRIVSESATSRCWAPSCRLRSSRRRSAVPASTIRARDARSSSTRARSCACSRSFSIDEPGGRGDRADQLRVVAQRAVVHDRADGAALALHAGERAGGIVLGGQRRRAAVRVDPAALVLQPVDDLQRAVAERVGEQLAQPAAVERRRSCRCSSSVTAPACSTRERSRPNRNAYGVSAKKMIASSIATLATTSGPLTACEVSAPTSSDEERDARPQDGRHRAALRQRGELPALDDDVEHVADHHDRRRAPSSRVRGSRTGRPWSATKIAEGGQPSQSNDSTSANISAGSGPEQAQRVGRRRRTLRMRGEPIRPSGYDSSMWMNTPT